MKKKTIRALFSWHILLTISVFLFAFVVPVLPENFGNIPARLGFTLIFITGIFSIDVKKKIFIYLVLGAILLNWVSVIFDLWIFVYPSKFITIIFFLALVFVLIKQIATAKIVASKEILESISGYLLIGIVFSIVISFIMLNDPAAYNVVQANSGLNESSLDLSASTYYGYVTLASLGYGDILPLKPYTRSLATLICIAGQLYIAILIALLVGKYASRKDEN